MKDVIAEVVGEMRELAEAINDGRRNGYSDTRDDLRDWADRLSSTPARALSEGLDFQAEVALLVGADEADQSDILNHLRAWIAYAHRLAAGGSSASVGGEGYMAVHEREAKWLADTCQDLPVALFNIIVARLATNAKPPALVVDDAMVERARKAWDAHEYTEHEGDNGAMRAALIAAVESPASAPMLGGR